MVFAHNNSDDERPSSVLCAGKVMMKNIGKSDRKEGSGTVYWCLLSTSAQSFILNDPY